MRSIAGALAVACLMSWATAANAELPRERRLLTVQHVRQPGEIAATGNPPRIIFMNRCANGCKVVFGATDSRTTPDKSQIGQGTLSAYKYGDPSWAMVMQCMKDTFQAFNVRITDKDPGSVDHFEILVGGTAGQVGLQAGVLGIAELDCSSPGSCGKFLPNTVVYTFANDSYFGAEASKELDICATAAQEIAHTWSLDHSIDKTDPMTYFPYAGMRTFKDGMKCGSDCQNGVGPQPFNLTCTANAHTCVSTGTATQDEIKILTALFGPSCSDDSGCEANYFCQDHACIAGPMIAGGLGATCSVDTDCLDGVCAAAGSKMACATSCDLNVDTSCPSGFGCLDAGKGDGTGVCWAGLDSGGCCDTGGNTNGAGAMLLALGLGAAFVTRRRRAKA